MAFYVLGKKLTPVKKAWKRLKSTLQSKLHHLKNSKAMNTSTRCVLNFPRGNQKNHHHHHHHHYYQHERYINQWRHQSQKHKKNASLICMEKPFEEIKDVDQEDKENEESTCIDLVLYGVDARAQDYIDKMKRQLWLERQESEESFDAMLARGI